MSQLVETRILFLQPTQHQRLNKNLRIDRCILFTEMRPFIGLLGINHQHLLNFLIALARLLLGHGTLHCRLCFNVSLPCP